MAANPDSYKNRYSYIPPTAQKAMDTHMQRNMPAHLQKYYQGDYVPQHAEKALSQHLKKNLPGHLQQYADAYMQQKVVWGHNPEHISARTTVAQPTEHNQFLHDARSGEDFHYGSQDNKQGETAPSFGGEVGTKTEGGQYDFILNPQKSLGGGLKLPGNTRTQRIILIAASLLMVIFLYSFVSGFLSKSGNAQKDRLLGLARTQYEIARVAGVAQLKISDKNLLYKAATVKASVESSRHELIIVLKERIKKVSTKQIDIKNPADDTVLKQGEDNGRYDQTYEQLLQKQLNEYQFQLQSIYNSGNSSEKNLAKSTLDQLKLLTNQPN